MSSNNTSTSNVTQDLSIALIIGLGIAIYRYQNQITELITSLIYIVITISAITLLGTMIYYAIKWAPRKYNPIGTDVDLTTFGTPDWDKDDDLYFNEKKKEFEPELKVQSLPARQEQPIFRVIETQKEECIIDTEKLLSTHLHYAEDLTTEDIYYLERKGYQMKEFVPLDTKHREAYYILEQKPESLEHTFVVYSIYNILKELKLSRIKVYPTQRPDIIITYEGKEYALEIETPRFLKKKHKRLLAKAATNNQLYGNRWWIVTTRSAYERSFRKYAQVLTKSQILDWINTTFPSALPPPE